MLAKRRNPIGTYQLDHEPNTLNQHIIAPMTPPSANTTTPKPKPVTKARDAESIGRTVSNIRHRPQIGEDIRRHLGQSEEEHQDAARKAE
jgi:hypothetical protein